MGKATRKQVFSLEMDVRWGDMDALGHVNNTVYFRYLEQARVSWLESVGGPLAPGRDGAVIVNAHCTFLVPIVYPARLEVRMYAGPPGRSSFETWYEIRRAGAERTLFAEGSAKIVWVDAGTARAVPLPEHIRALLPAPR